MESLSETLSDWLGRGEGPPRALEILAAQRQAELWDTSLSFLERGKAEDAKGDHRSALLLISEGIQGLLALSEVSKRDDVRSSYETIVAQYQNRLKQLRQILHSPPPAVPVVMGHAVDVSDAPPPQDTGGILGPSAAPAQAVAPAVAAPSASDEPQVTAPSAPDPVAAALAQGRLCVELAVTADESGDSPAKDIAELYTAAAEHYFEALKLEPDDTLRAQHRGTLANILERAEKLKGLKLRQGSDGGAGAANASSQAEAPAARAPGLEAADPGPSTSATGPTAAAAPAPAAAPTAASASAASTGASTAASPPAAAPTPRPSPAASARGSQPLGEEEKLVLARSSTIGGKLFYPYLSDGHRERFHYTTPWDDPDGLLPLSAKQQEHFGRWVRPSEFLPGAAEPKMIYLVSSMSITQTIITDCSFVSSLVIAAAYERRHGKQLITNIIFPQDRSGVPLYNPAGKYLVKLHVNGIERKVVVDDLLPLSKDGRLMTSHTTHGAELWVQIIEKAYMKVNGGYDFPGSNSGIDMFALTGWIPEQFRTDDADFDSQRLWERMTSASRFGDCLLTVATGELKEFDGQEEDKVGLVSTHAYAVLQVRQVLGQRLVQLKNPWSCLRWKGAYSVSDTARWTAELQKALAYDPAGAAQYDNGVFWIDYASLLKYFQAIYLNWNPGLFAHNTTHHGQWPKKTSRLGPGGEVLSDTANLGRNPQYAFTVTVPAGRPAAVWVLLTRHTTRKDQGSTDFLTVHVFRQRGGFRVYYLEQCWRQGVYSNRPHCLVQFDLPPGTHKLTLALAQYSNVPHQVDYSLKVYSMAAFTLRKLPLAMKDGKRAQGEWKGLSAGGCGNFDTVIDSPQYVVQLDQVTDLAVELTGPAKFAVGLELAPFGSDAGGPGGRSTPLATTGNYRNGFCILEVPRVPPGRYVLTPATFEPRQEGPFALLVGSNAPVALATLPHEGHGLHRQMVRGEWSAASGSAAGCVNHRNFHKNPQLKLTLTKPAEVLMRLRTNASGAPLSEARPYLSIDVYGPRGGALSPMEAEAGQSAPKLISGNGKYSYPPGGALVPRTQLEAGSYILVLSTFDPHSCGFELLLFSTPGSATLERIVA